jgi:hypothetical protein
MGVPLTKKRIRVARAAYKRLGSLAAVERETGIDTEVVKKYCVDCKNPVKPNVDRSGGGRQRRLQPTPVDPIAEAKRKARERAAQEAYVAAIREHAFRNVLVRAIKDATTPLARAPQQKHKSTRRGHLRFPMLPLNDWHFEEIVKPDGVLGLNEYSIEIACQRVWRVIHAALDWKHDAEAGGRFRMDEITVPILGDLITGTLHGLERHSNAANVVRAGLMCGDLLGLALADLAANFCRVRVVGVVGNHGRLPDDKKVPTKDPTRSWDYLAYEVARRRLSNHRNITWHLPEAYGALYQVGGHWCYAAHGNFIPNNLGVVGYGVRRFTSSLASNLQAAGKPLRYAFFGHWHSANSSEFAGVEAFICPSLIGTQEYSFLSGGAVNKPAQHLFVFDKELGLVSMERLYGSGPGYDGTYKLPDDATQLREAA